MFKSLRNKLKNWVSKSKQEQQQVEEKEKSKKKNKEKSKKKNEKENNQETQQVERSKFSLFKKKLTEEKFEQLFEELELILLQNNVAYEAVEKIKQQLAEELIGKNLSNINLEEKLKQAIESLFQKTPDFLKEVKSSLAVKKPYIIAFVGVNGSGKTTTIAKIAYLLKKSGLSICLAAADTFRAASIEQIENHASQLNIPVIKKPYGADPASVGYDAIQYAKAHNIDIVLIDTAGRIQTKDSLMKELEKITRVANPNMKIFVAESIVGNDAIEQARTFNQAIDLDGIILSKADVDEKGGAAISISHITKKPILFLGTGQEYKDLEKFDKNKLLKKLF
ncbi:MAG: signal recognition particle-docking protein FtsY [Candidatus Nanoarchaeia archaeon]